MTFSDITIRDALGNEREISAFNNKVLLVVNTASKCGFTPQYKGLESLYQRYRAEGLEILAFPCNQFGQQEPEDNEQIQTFCSLNYDVSFPVMSKIEVNGKNTSALYAYLKRQAPGLFGSQAIKWNFTKFLISKDRQDITRYAPKDKPEALVSKIETLLRQ